MANTNSAGADGAKTPNRAAAMENRRRYFTYLAGGVGAAALIYGGWWLLVGSHYVSTDDAYVGADVAAITPQVGGTVAEVKVADTDKVKAGDVLAVIDPIDAKLAEAQAAADYGRAVRRVKQDFASSDAAAAQVGARDADLAHARALLAAAESADDKARIDFERRQALAASGAVSGDELTNAKNAYKNAEANLAAAKAGVAQAEASIRAAKGQSAAASALVAGAGVDDNPEVRLAKAAWDTAKVNLQRTVIRAPFDGVVARRNVQVGQRVAVGAQLMTVVPVAKAFVDANFKEVQLRQVRVGQPVELESDLYGGGVKYHGVVAGLGGGTGAAFSLIPAQNASGNWIKVVQRLPVRVMLDPKELAEHPLRVGLSMKATVDTSKRDGALIEAGR
jgi:membrane fusion protein (multidrug efflux system)